MPSSQRKPAPKAASTKASDKSAGQNQHNDEAETLHPHGQALRPPGYFDGCPREDAPPMFSSLSEGRPPERMRALRRVWVGGQGWRLEAGAPPCPTRHPGHDPGLGFTALLTRKRKPSPVSSTGRRRWARGVPPAGWGCDALAVVLPPVIEATRLRSPPSLRPLLLCGLCVKPLICPEAPPCSCLRVRQPPLTALERAAGALPNTLPPQPAR
jgi:hypothetical protein